VDLEKEKIASEINNNILSIKLSDSLKLINVERYVFPDKYPINAHYNERIFILQKNKEKIGLFQFGVRKINDIGLSVSEYYVPITITLDFVQGVKQNKSNISFSKGWQETIINAFILACSPVLEKNPEIKIRYSEFIPYLPGKDRNTERKLLLEKLQKEYQELLSSNQPNKEKFLLEKKLEIFKAQKKIQFINAIRDRYFDKEGYLNLNKERVKKIFLFYARNKKQTIIERNLNSQNKEKSKKISKEKIKLRIK
jgi:hypothetical protein